ncbi:MAG: hypothetical protein RBU30_26075 [Polyangia bacterium]|jgi:hypothetical protein|nr:hypothetical protein [Polyangia bacterium]
MGLVIEQLLRSTPLSETEREVCLRGIAQVAMADGVEDPRERAYLEKFVDEFFPNADPTDSAWNAPLTEGDLEKLESLEAKKAFLGYGYITAYVDEDYVEAEAKLLDGWASVLVSAEIREEIITSVREFLYRRSVFAYAFRLGRLDEEFAVRAASRFAVPVERAREINAGVFNAIMTLKNPTMAEEAGSGA